LAFKALIKKVEFARPFLFSGLRRAPSSSASETRRILLMFRQGNPVMFARRFAEGDRVIIVGGAVDKTVRAGTYTVVRLMPMAGLGFQYRVKAALDAHERVLDEYRLAPAKS
jgi:hypothetical protein